MRTTSAIQDKTMQFSLSSIDLYKLLIEEREYIISKQFLKSSTSIGANVREAKGAQSDKDFVHKLELALKEAYETHYWLILLKEGTLTKLEVTQNLNDSIEIIKILVSIINTKKRNMQMP